MIGWLGPIVYEYYASTEGNGATFIDSREWLLKPGSVGRSALGPAHVCDEAGSELPAGEDGLIYFETARLPFEYHNDPGKTRSAQHPEHPNWTAVGDIGHLDADGYLFLTDRKDFMIISGGVNIYPREIEDKAPRSVDFDADLPRTPTGKLLKHVIRARCTTPANPSPAQHGLSLS